MVCARCCGISLFLAQGKHAPQPFFFFFLLYVIHRNKTIQSNRTLKYDFKWEVLSVEDRISFK